MRKRICCVYLVIIMLFVLFSSGVYAAENTEKQSSPWIVYPYFNLGNWGLGIVGGYKGYPLFDGVDTIIYGSLCGYYEMSGYYHNTDGTLYTPSIGLDWKEDRGLYQREGVATSLGIKQGVLFNETENRNLVDVFLFYINRNNVNIPESSPSGALIFESDMPDKYELHQNSLIMGSTYDNLNYNPDTLEITGLRSEISVEVAPQSFNQSADFTRTNFTAMDYFPVYQSEELRVTLTDWFIYDSLSGAVIPVYDRTSFGGLGMNPGILYPGVGGFNPGIQPGRFDGYTKIANRFGGIASFPKLFHKNFIPIIVGYYDLGFSDNLTGTVDFSNPLSTVSAGCGFRTKFIAGLELFFQYNYFLNEKRPSVAMTLNFY